METLYINIALFNLKIEFEPFIKYGSPHQRDKFIKEIKNYLKNFTIEKPKKTDFTISAITTLINYVDSKQPNSVAFLLFKKINNKKYETYTYLNVLQFQAILQDVLFSLTVKNRGFVFHASAIAESNNAFLFLGKPTAGKSTAIRLLKNFLKPISDDTAIVRKISGKYLVFPTPFIEKQYWLNKPNQPYILKKIFFLSKSKITYTKKIDDSTEILDQLINHLLISKENNKTILQDCLTLIKETNFYLLNFRKNSKELEFILNGQEPLVTLQDV